MVAPALALGVGLRVLAAAEDESVSQVPGVILGDYLDLASMREFAGACDVLTIYQEGVPPGLLRILEAEGVRLQPCVDALIRAQDLGEEVSDGDCKIGVLVARSPHGQAAVWAPTEILNEDSGFITTIAPAPGLSDAVAGRAQQLALEMSGLVNLVGVMNVQMFVIQEQVILGQITLGPSEFGCWTIEGSVTSQFEQHLRAILDLPLGATDLLAPFVVSAAIIGVDKPDLYRPYLHVFASDPFVKVHQYGKVFSPGTKLGHVTVIGNNVLDLRQRAAHAADYISGVIDE